MAVRNTSTWSGNLAMKYKHNEFPSDVFISFVSVNATLTLIGPDRTTMPVQVNLVDFLKTNMTGKFIYSVAFRQFDKASTYLRTYKIMPRYRNAHAYVNAGFNFSVNPVSYKIQSLPTIVYGSIDAGFVHAKQTELYLFGKAINDQNILQSAFKILAQELDPKYGPDLSSVEYRRSLAISLLYKFLLYVNDKFLSPRYRSGQNSVMDMRPVTTSEQVFPTFNQEMFPVTEPMSKLNAYYQTSGEAKYVYDLPTFPNQLFGVFIQASVANCTIGTINTSEASKVSGVVKFIFAHDIVGMNDVARPTFGPDYVPEELFCSSKVDYAGQGIGLVIAGNNLSVKIIISCCF